MLLAAPSLQAETWVPWPTKEQLRKIQLEAYSCSRENIEAPCSNSRELADALMDHPRLPGICNYLTAVFILRAKVASDEFLLYELCRVAVPWNSDFRLEFVV